MTGESSPAESEPGLEEAEIAAGGERRAGEHDRVEPVEQQLAQHGREVERHGRQAELLARARVRSIQRTVGGPPPAGRSVRLRPSEMPSSRRMTAAELLQQRASPLGFLGLAPAGRRSSPPISRSARNAPSVGIELEGEALVPDRVGREVVASRSWPAGEPSQAIEQAQEHARRWLAGRRPARAAGAAGAGRGWRGSAGRLAAHELVGERRRQAAAVPLEPRRAAGAPPGW